jgi:hypothetical protein
MAGSGTTLVEAELLGRTGLGVEIDPLARLLCRVKTTPLAIGQLQAYSESLIADIADKNSLYDRGELVPTLPAFRNRDYWFLPEVAAKLALIEQAISDLSAPIECKRFFGVALSSLILARTSVANARDIVHSRPHHFVHQKPPDVATLFQDRLERMAKQMQTFVEQLAQVPSASTAQIIGDDARRLPLGNDTIDLVVTSPPYCNALDYTRAHMLAVAWLSDFIAMSLEEYSLLGRRYIGTDRAAFAHQPEEKGGALQIPLVRQIIADISEQDRKKGMVVRRYFGDMWQVLNQIGRVLRPGGHAALVVCPSNIRKIPIPTHQAFEQMAHWIELPEQFGFELVFRRERTINDRRRLMPYIGMEERMRTEYVLVFKKSQVVCASESSREMGT